MLSAETPCLRCAVSQSDCSGGNPCSGCAAQELPCSYNLDDLQIRKKQADGRLPMTLLSGFLGAGKTTMLKNILKNRFGIKAAVLVNDLGAVNVDARAVQHLGSEKLVELSNGCMCCGLKDELLQQIAEIAKAKKYDVLVVEGSGVAEPMPIAEGISSFDIGRGKVLEDIVKLDTLVTVVDAPNFLDNYNSKKRVAEAEGLAEEAGTDAKMAGNNVASLMVEQVEFANVVVLNKISEVAPSAVHEARAIIAHINPGAQIITTNYSCVSPADVLCTDSYDIDDAESAPGWEDLGAGKFVPKVKALSIANAIFAKARPFHPGRLGSLIADDGAKLRACGLVRSKGIFWIATRSDVVGEWQHAGMLFRFVQSSVPWGKACEGQSETAAVTLSQAEARGIRRQEIVLIGPNLQVERCAQLLEDCLLTAEEEALRTANEAQCDPSTWWQQFRSQLGDHDFPALEGSADAAAVAATAADAALREAQAAKAAVTVAKWGGQAAAESAQLKATEQLAKAKAAEMYAQTLADQAKNLSQSRSSAELDQQRSHDCSHSGGHGAKRSSRDSKRSMLSCCSAPK